jgi:hypothetical protein
VSCVASEDESAYDFDLPTRSASTIRADQLTHDQTCTPSLPSFPGTIKCTVSAERRMIHNFERALSDRTISGLSAIDLCWKTTQIADYVIKRHWLLLS